MKEKLRKYAIILIFPLHLGLMRFMSGGTDVKWIAYALMLFVLFADFALSFWQMEIFTSGRNRISDFARDFLPYLLQKVVLIAAELLLMLWMTDRNFGILLAYGTAAVSMILCGIVTFVTGAARTMMYHDEKR